MKPPCSKLNGRNCTWLKGSQVQLAKKSQPIGLLLSVDDSTWLINGHCYLFLVPYLKAMWVIVFRCDALQRFCCWLMFSAGPEELSVGSWWDWLWWRDGSRREKYQSEAGLLRSRGDKSFWPWELNSTTAVILKGISLFWGHFEWLWPWNTELGYPQFDVPTQKQFHEVVIVL